MASADIVCSISTDHGNRDRRDEHLRAQLLCQQRTPRVATDSTLKL